MTLNYLLIIILPFLLSFLATPLIIDFAFKKRFFDEPNDRKNHKLAIPRIGGIIIFLGTLLSLIFLFLIIKSDYSSEKNFLLVFILCSCSFFILGLIDDIKSISPFLRLFSQFVFASFAWKGVIKFNGLYFSNNLNNGFFPIDSEIVSYLLTVVWIVGVINSINWIDGMDGLLIGITCIYSLTFSIIEALNQDFSGLFLSLIIFFSCLGFIKYNKYPAKIMTGDGGSYFLGFYLSIASLKTFSEVGVVNPFLLITLLFIPLIDMLRVILLRIIQKKSPFFPDRSHIHFLLFDSGISYKKCLFLIFFISILFSSFNIFLNL